MNTNMYTTAIWPGSSLHYREVISSPRYEDFDIKSNDKNPFAYFGKGWALDDRRPGADHCSYISVDKVDPQWLRAIASESPPPYSDDEISERLSSVLSDEMPDDPNSSDTEVEE